MSIKWKSKFHRQKSNFKTNLSQQQEKEGEEGSVRPRMQYALAHIHCPYGGAVIVGWGSCVNIPINEMPWTSATSFVIIFFFINEKIRFACACGRGCRCTPPRFCRAKIICRMLFVEFRMRLCYTQTAQRVQHIQSHNVFRFSALFSPCSFGSGESLTVSNLSK